MTLIEYLHLAEKAMDGGPLPERERVELEAEAGPQWMGEAKAELTGNAHHPIKVMFFYDHIIYFIELQKSSESGPARYRWELDISWNRGPTVVDEYLMAVLVNSPSITMKEA